MIKKLFITVIVFILSFIYTPAQQQNPNVELPDFVITGTDVIAVRGADKISPEFVSTISEQFIKPAFSPEELEVRDLSSPLKADLNIMDSLSYLRGNLEFGAGIYKLPFANVSYLFPFNNLIVNGKLTGENHLAHVDNSERYLINGGLNLLYTTDNNSEVLPATQFRFDGNLSSTSYKFYSINNPPKRTLNQGKFSLGVINQFNRQFNFDVSINDEISLVDEENYSENILELKGFTKMTFNPFNFSISGTFKKQSLTIDNTSSDITNSDVDDFFSIKPVAGFNISEAVKISGGISYSKSGGSSYTALFASLLFKLNRFISFFGEYSPHAEFLTSNDLLKTNRYFEPQNFYNFFYRKRNALVAAVKFEYDKYYQLNAGIRYFNSPEFPYFIDSITTGRFMISAANVSSFTFFTDLLFHLGPYGIMYGEIEFSDTKDGDKFIPYNPQIRVSAMYGYEFAFGLKSEIRLKYISKSYTDLMNSKTVSGYFDLDLKFLYKILPDFFFTVDLSNLFNNDIYNWQGYKEAPLDIVAGFKYIW